MPEAERTCVVTRAVAGRDELVRLVASPDGDVIVDYRGRLPGRGAWILPTAEALAGLPRAAKRIEAQIGAKCVPEDLRIQLRDAVVRAIADGLSMGAAAGCLVLGHDVLVEAVARGSIAVVVVAADAADRTVRSVERAGDVERVRVPLTAEEVGRRVGRQVVAVLGVPDIASTTHLRKQLRRLAALG